MPRLNPNYLLKRLRKLASPLKTKRQRSLLKRLQMMKPRELLKKFRMPSANLRMKSLHLNSHRWSRQLRRRQPDLRR